MDLGSPRGRDAMPGLAALLACALGCLGANPAFKGVATSTDGPAPRLDGGDPSSDAARDAAGPEPAAVDPPGAVDAVAAPVDAAGPAADAAAEAADAATADAASPELPAPDLVDAAAVDIAADIAALTVDAMVDTATVDLARDAVPPAPDGPLPLYHYDFETSTQGWADIRYMHYGVGAIAVSRSTAIPPHSGTGALEMPLTTPRTDAHPVFGITASADMKARMLPGVRIRQWIWFPPGTQLDGVQAFIYYYRQGANPPRWEGDMTLVSSLTPGIWHPLDEVVPDDVDLGKGGVIDWGIEWTFKGPQAQPVKVYVDDVSILPP